ncbi:hypothetical protein BDK51DRAFT_37266 [Blyttiomyces helicus]|uniref:EGF-like domain-containing protein n=1 Tax=Blyttiomyces helicus TaxID=388810 RepID=A0A4P9WBB9_9FUNG|nr:hypothetical protein BDK51DRAFT_37266 [Blyttiomyces helicus]|eukprot:RKO89774.1 hypothetical protein BDK51DRAFT_37266 [Blyttiomyces helicus]
MADHLLPSFEDVERVRAGVSVLHMGQGVPRTSKPGWGKKGAQASLSPGSAAATAGPIRGAFRVPLARAAGLDDADGGGARLPESVQVSFSTMSAPSGSQSPSRVRHDILTTPSRISRSTTSLDPSALVASFTSEIGGTVELNAQTALVQFASVNEGTYDGAAFFYYTNNGDDVPWDQLQCPFDCYGNGKCVQGKCVCYDGYEGGLCKNDDRFQLNQIYDACGGPSWTVQGGWGDRNGSLGNICPPTEGSYEQPSNWTNIQCYLGRVDIVNLRGANLSCPNGLPSSAAWYASVWDFSDNRIGDVPGTFFVGSFHIYGTALNFSTTGFVSNLSGMSRRITALDLSNNNISGVIPALLADATYVYAMYLENNNFYGVIPIGFYFYAPNAVWLAENQVRFPSYAWLHNSSSGLAYLPPLHPALFDSLHLMPPSNNDGRDAEVRLRGRGHNDDGVRGGVHGRCRLPVPFWNTGGPGDGSQRHSYDVRNTARASGKREHDRCVRGAADLGGQLSRCRDRCLCAWLSPAARANVGAICEGGSALPYPQYGWHRSIRNDSVYLQCFQPSACPSDPVSNLPPAATWTAAGAPMAGGDQGSMRGGVQSIVVEVLGLQRWTGARFGSLHRL